MDHLLILHPPHDLYLHDAHFGDEQLVLFHEDKDHKEDVGLADDFENFLHSGNTGDIHQQPDIKISCNTIATVYITAIFDFQIKPVESPPPIVLHFNYHIPLLRHSISPKGLRAPPCDLV